MEPDICITDEQPLYLAAARVTPGIYEEIESLRQVILKEEGFLPASCDGRVACYQRVRSSRTALDNAQTNCVVNDITLVNQQHREKCE